ncbi:MAG: hopanoid biosynthesis-associated protein HpnK [Proteobacteria bacterium]|nr:hopanoid biosynthesis-associated protein HpnK [Pseudomonadota bacterium]
MEPLKLLIVTADDFGLHPAVNGAVERAAREGVLTAASLMVGAPAAADAVRRARDLPGLAVGLHLVLADGCSVLPPSRIPALVDAQGRFGNNMVRDGVRFFALPAVRRQLEAEIRAQFQAFADTGLLLDHVNAHKHFHLHPTLLEMLVRIGGEFGISAVRLPREPAWAARRAGGAIAGSTVAGLLSPWLAIMRRRLRAARIAHNDHVFGMSGSGAMDEARLLEILGKLPEGVTEIYLHPGVESGAAIAASMSGYRHADELAALVSPRVRAAIGACGAATGGFRQISPRSREERHAA